MILIVAIALAVVASFALWSYIQGVKDDLAEDTQLVEVLILTRDIEQGATGESVQNTSIATEQIPANFKPGNAITNRDQILGKVAVSNLAARQILVPGMFIDPALAATTFADYLNPNMVTVSLPLGEVNAAGGLLAPGDLVNILIKVQEEASEADPAEGDTTDTGGGGDAAASTGTGTGTGSDGPDWDGPVVGTPVRYLYQAAEILAIDGRIVPQAGEAVAATAKGAGGGTFTFQVPPDVAQLLYSIDPGQLYFSLIAQDYVIEALPPLTDDVVKILPGENGEILTFCGPTGPSGCEPDDDSVDDGGINLGFNDDEQAADDAADAESVETGVGG